MEHSDAVPHCPPLASEVDLKRRDALTLNRRPAAAAAGSGTFEAVSTLDSDRIHAAERLHDSTSGRLRPDSGRLPRRCAGRPPAGVLLRSCGDPARRGSAVHRAPCSFAPGTSSPLPPPLRSHPASSGLVWPAPINAAPEHIKQAGQPGRQRCTSSRTWLLHYSAFVESRLHS